MTQKRDIFSELTEGFDALKALRGVAKLGFDDIERGEYVAFQSDQDIDSFIGQKGQKVKLAVPSPKKRT